MPNLAATIEACKNKSGLALADALKQTDLRRRSEKSIADGWLKILRNDTDFHQDGWYSPPPHGIIALIGKPENGFARIRQPSFRPEPMWPQTDILYEPDDILALYASPVHQLTHIIGDFGLNLYFGQDRAIHDHFETVLRTALEIAGKTKVGMPFNELYTSAMQLGASRGFANNIESSTDKTGTNIGHTIPFSYRSDATHETIKKAASFEAIKTVVSSGRKFINGGETQRIEDNMAFTIEPRFSTASMPNTWFHLTVIFEKGERRICHGFKPVMQQFGMQKLLNLLPG